MVKVNFNEGLITRMTVKYFGLHALGISRSCRDISALGTTAETLGRKN